MTENPIFNSSNSSKCIDVIKCIPINTSDDTCICFVLEIVKVLYVCGNVCCTSKPAFAFVAHLMMFGSVNWSFIPYQGSSLTKSCIYVYIYICITQTVVCEWSTLAMDVYCVSTWVCDCACKRVSKKTGMVQGTQNRFDSAIFSSACAACGWRQVIESVTA